MIDIENIYDNLVLCESFSTPKYIFDDGELTFADIRDIFTKLFSGGLTMKEQVDGIDLLITCKDGNICAAPEPRYLKEPLCMKDACCLICKKTPENEKCIAASLDDISNAIKTLDQMKLNKYFANGKNFMNCKLVCPDAQCQDGDGKCFIELNGLKCFNDKFKDVGEDKDSAQQLFNDINQSKCIDQSQFELSQPAVLKLKNLSKSKNILAKINAALSEFINGLGWRSTLNDYIQDRYSRYIVNKALKYGVDVSKSSPFVSELASRLSNVSGRKPTKSDLMTFAKRSGIDCKSEEYKKLIDDLEANAEQTNTDIVRPLENLIAYAALMLIRNVEGYMYADRSNIAKKTLSQLDTSLDDMNESDVKITPKTIEAFKKNLSKVEKYYETMPKTGIAVTYKGKVYKLCPNFGDAHAILNIIRYK